MLLLLPSSENPQRSILNLNGSPRFLAGANLNLRLLLTIFVCLSAAAAFALHCRQIFLALKGRLILFMVCSSVVVCCSGLESWHWLTLCHRCDRSVPEIATVVVAVAIFFATLLASLPVAKKLPLPLLPPLLLRSFQS